jgi:hypothetical protein
MQTFARSLWPLLLAVAFACEGRPHQTAAAPAADPFAPVPKLKAEIAPEPKAPERPPLLPPDPSDEQGSAAYWQRAIENSPPPDLSDAITNVFHSMLVFPSKGQRYELQFTFRPGAGLHTLRIIEDGRESLSLLVDVETVFRLGDGVLYCVFRSRPQWGRPVVAYDLATGKTLWHTPIHYEPSGTLRSTGRFTLRLTKNVVYIAGEESTGKYIEILDQKTGKRLAEKVFPSEVPKLEPAGPFPDDPRLDAKVTCDYPTPTTMLLFFRDLSKQTGIPLTVPPELEDGRITCVKHTESLRTAMRCWTESTNGTWVLDGAGYRFLLAEHAPPRVEETPENGR